MIRSVARRRLRESEVGALRVETTSLASARAAKVIGVTQFELPTDKKCQVTVTVKNTGGSTLTGDIYMYAFYGFDFPPSSGDPAADYDNWDYFASLKDSGSVSNVTLKPGDTKDITGDNPWSGSSFSAGDVLDVGIVIAFDDGSGKKYVDSVFYDDYIKIVEPGKLEISDVSFEAVDRDEEGFKHTIQ